MIRVSGLQDLVITNILSAKFRTPQQSMPKAKHSSLMSLFFAPLSGGDWVALVFSGNVAGVEEIKRRTTLISVAGLIAVVLAMFAVATHIYGVDGSLACILGLLIGVPTRLMAIRAAKLQEKASLRFEAAIAANKFLSRVLQRSMQLAAAHLADIVGIVSHTALVADERAIPGPDDLPHLALAPRLLPTPAAPR